MARSNSKTILVAEDTAAIRSIIAFLLRAKGYNVLEASNGNDALDQILGRRPDLVVLDVLMPGKTGFDVCAYLKANEETRSIPILILTSITRDSGRTEEHWKAISGADDFVHKPFKTHDLIERIGRLLSHRSESARFERLPENGDAVGSA